MTAHLISILSELKMSSFGLYTGVKTRCPSGGDFNQLHSVEGCAKCPTVPQRRELVTGTRAAGHGS